MKKVVGTYLSINDKALEDIDKFVFRFANDYYVCHLSNHFYKDYDYLNSCKLLRLVAYESEQETQENKSNNEQDRIPINASTNRVTIEKFYDNISEGIQNLIQIKLTMIVIMMMLAIIIL